MIASSAIHHIKLQNFKKVYPETAEYLREGVAAGGLPLYRSCQTGNFDLYLPFIEHGLTLLNAHGRLGYIAPSVWRFNEYGRGLRQLVKQKKALDRWVDFGSYQAFEEATTYTALQFYSNAPMDHVQIALAHDGALANIPDWDDPAWRLDYKELHERDPWVFASRPTLNLIEKLRGSCVRLGSDDVTELISQGLISGAFDIFALERAGLDSYRSRAGDVEKSVNIEDKVTRPLISASDIDRFVIHAPALSIIFPYDIHEGRPSLLHKQQFKDRYPHAWDYLKSHETDLRKRDAGQFTLDGDEKDRWYAFSRNQNLDKQLVPRSSSLAQVCELKPPLMKPEHMRQTISAFTQFSQATPGI